MTINKNLIVTVIAVLFMSGVLASCSALKYQRPKLDLLNKFRNSNTDTGQDTLNIAQLSYRDFFQDTVLIKLIDKAINQNNDLRVALKQIEIASLGYNQSKWNYVPKVDATIANATITRPSDNSVNAITSGNKYVEEYSSSVSTSWEVDVWGKIKGIREESLVEYLQTQEAAKAVKTRIVSEVVQGYYNLLMLDKQLEITRSNLAFADSTLLLLRKQRELGMTTSLAVQQQEITNNQILKTVSAIEASINIQENALNILVGEMPNTIERQTGLVIIQCPKGLSTGIPSEMLSYRPDVKGSELRLRQSMASIHVAKVSMYPALNITGQGGVNAFKSSNWFNIPGSLFGLASGTIAQPILQHRQLKTRYEQSKIESEQAKLNFKQSILVAVGEVADALIQIEKLEEQQKVAVNLVEQADGVLNTSLTLFKYNEATYLEVIIAQTNKLQAELDLASIKTQKLNAITVLYRSLGGGWQ